MFVFTLSTSSVILSQLYIFLATSSSSLLLFLGCYLFIYYFASVSSQILPLVIPGQGWVIFHLIEGFGLCLNVGHSHPQEVFILPPDFPGFSPSPNICYH